MRIARVLTSLALLSVVGSSALRAQWVSKNFYDRCSPGTVRACASYELQTFWTGSQTVVVLKVRNLQGSGWGIDNTGGSIITRIGLTAPTGMTGAANLAVGSGGATQVGGSWNPMTYWSLRGPAVPPGTSTTGIGGSLELTAGLTGSNTREGGIVGCALPTSPPTKYFDTCSPGGWVQFFFTTTNQWSASSAELAWLTDGIVNPQSQWPGIECGTTDDGPGGREYCTVATPEPVTMLLLGSGLAGVGGVGVIRRRRGKDVATD